MVIVAIYSSMFLLGNLTKNLMTVFLFSILEEKKKRETKSGCKLTDNNQNRAVLLVEMIDDDLLY